MLSGIATYRDQCVTSGLLRVLALGAEFELCYKAEYACVHWELVLSDVAGQ